MRSVRPAHLVVAWALLLAASTAWRRAHPVVPPPVPGARLLRVALDGAVADIAVRDSRPAGGVGVPLLLVHGSPGSGEEVAALGRLLGSDRRTLVPDLPGFGGSTRQVPDYSVRAHARWMWALLDSLRIAEVHLLGFSMGGGVVEEMLAQHPGRARSLMLLSAIGVQEHELLGDYHLNHAIHGLQLAALRGVRDLVPHFGAWDDAMLGVEYARNFFDTDQRPLRGILAAWDGPALVIQGRDDVLVPTAAALEHARIVPQAELHLLDSDHFMAFTSPGRLAPLVAGFLERAERGEAPTRATAPPARRLAAADPSPVRAATPAEGFAAVIVLLLLAVATLASEDLACIAAGLLVARGSLAFWPATAACAAGIFGGDLLLYLAGRWLGRPWLRRAPLRWAVPADRVRASEAWFARRGASLLVTSRFLPGSRLPTYVGAGVLGMPLRTFAGWTLVAVAAWTPLLVGASALAGEALRMHLQQVRGLRLLLLAAALLVIMRVGAALVTWRGRRLVLGRWRRLTRWEFWPAWAVYPPVVLYVLWLGLRHRSLTLFTAANPGIPLGGWVGESKAAILAALAREAPAHVPRAELVVPPLAAQEAQARVQRFLEREGLALPVVCKPDAGERGSGVVVARTADDAAAYLARARVPVLLQEHVPGAELGVLYWRMPGEASGHVFSVTDKRFAAVTGDGRRDLEALVLADDRLVCTAPRWLARLGDRLREVPRAGETVALGDLGNHCRGAAFLDGHDLLTPELAALVDRLGRAMPGFWFGRFDLRAPTRDDLLAARGVKVIELNGVTSEATHIYDPRHGLGRAWATLFAQWRLLFAIGAANRARGHRPARLRELVEALLAHRRAVATHPAT